MANPFSTFGETGWLRSSIVLLPLLAVAVPLEAKQKLPPPAVAPVETMPTALRRQADRELLGVYAARNYRPLWFSAEGALDPAATALVKLIENSAIDEVDPRASSGSQVAVALRQFDGDASLAARSRAEIALSRGLVDLIRAMREAPAATMTYEHSSLRPQAPRRADALWAAANAPSLEEYVRTMGWMHPLYAPLRNAALAEGGDARGPAVRETLRRIRALAPTDGGRSIVVDAANARLTMYEGSRAVDTMRVVVGKPDRQTPMLAGYVRHAIVNPFWNVPDDMIRGKIASNVLSRGPGYLRTAGYQVLSDWSPTAAPIDPASVDWRKVASGQRETRIRQLPSAGNAMGRVKFEFPNPLGIYLHDTPDKGLMLKDQRQFSSGCVRLEDAERLGRWLMQGPLKTSSNAPEQKIGLPKLVPIYITYLTARPEAGRIALGPDPYGRDGVAGRALASAGGANSAVTW